MAGQRTFTLIPQHPGRSGDSPSGQPARPMTSKQVRKAYKAANGAPRLSRAEIIRQEKAEQERIRKEFEKEKAAAKARAAREKKKGKELAEREEKRKRGLPTVSVRPSQDTISWFVRGNGTARKRDCEGRGLGAGETPEPVTPCPARGSTLVNIAEEEEEEENQVEEGGNHTEEKGKQAAEDEEAQRELKVEVEPVSETLEPDLVDLDEDFEDDLALEMLQDVEESVKKASTKNPEPNHQHDSPALPKTTAPTISPHQAPMTRYEQDLGLQRPARKEPPQPASPPNEPTRHNPSTTPSPSPPRQAPPMSTQAILFNFDDYFPSPSQQARELEEEIAEEHESSAHRSAQARPPPKPSPETEPSLPNPRVDSPSPPPRRFFTSSGSHELMSLALHRSRRTAALEQIQRRERERVQAGIAIRQAEARVRRDKAMAAAAAARQSKPAPRPAQPEERRPQMKTLPVAKQVSKPTWKPEKGVDRQAPMACQPQTKPPKDVDKENVKPPVDKPQVPSASQESEYGGAWVDEIALELMI